jgi:hypothetical protein
MVRSDRKGVATVSAALLWLLLHAIVALPAIVDPLAMLKTPVYVLGILLVLEPLICFWAYYQYRYMMRAEPKLPHGDNLEA